MHRRKLGRQGLEVSAIGLGAMGMSEFYGPADEAESIATLHRALELGVDFVDTADMYGRGQNEELVGRALHGRRQNVTLATMFGIVRSNDPAYRAVNGRPEYVKYACEASLKRLGVDHIDLYYQHRVDLTVPIEDTVTAMADLVQAGKVRYIGLSEASATNIRRAHAVHPISAVQSEYSLWSRDIEEEVLPTCRALGIGFVAFSPLGRGFLTASISKLDDLAPNDYRRSTPRFQGANFERNLRLAAAVKLLADKFRITPAQLSLAWVLSQGQDIVPIPGTKRRQYLEDNVKAANILLSPATLAAIETAVPKGQVAGARYADMSWINR